MENQNSHPLFFLITLIIIFSYVTVPCAAESTFKEFLAVHNTARGNVGVAPLQWNETLATFALSFAKKVKVQCNHSIRSHSPYGENIAFLYNTATLTAAVNDWMGQKTYYNHETNTCGIGSDGCKEYTQMVWRNSSRVGCASVVSAGGWRFVVCEYDPPGNVPGENPYRRST